MPADPGASRSGPKANFRDGPLPLRCKILEKKGDLSDPNNYRGIMLLEVAMKVIAYILKVRLVAISETLPHEMQNGFRPGRGTPATAPSTCAWCCGS
jgi:hypothetical protein